MEMSSALIANPGDAKGHISFVSTGRMMATDILSFHPEIQAKLDLLEKKGWKYLFIEMQGTSNAEISFDRAKFKIVPSPRRVIQEEHEMVSPDNTVEISIGQELPKVVGIPEVQLFKINICSKSFPRAATVDLSKDEVTYLHDFFWKWEPGSELDERKLSDAMEVYAIASWLIDENKFRPTGDVTQERYDELSYRFKNILDSK